MNGAAGYGLNDLIVILLVLCIIAFGLMAICGPTIGEIAAQINAARQSEAVIPHANARHGTEADVARQCADRPDWVFFNPATNRTAFGCWTDSGKLGVFIIERTGQEVTAFLKNKMSKVEQLFKYMENQGYNLLP